MSSTTGNRKYKIITGSIIIGSDLNATIAIRFSSVVSIDGKRRVFNTTNSFFERTMFNNRNNMLGDVYLSLAKILVSGFFTVSNIFILLLMGSISKNT